MPDLFGTLGMKRHGIVGALGRDRDATTRFLPESVAACGIACNIFVRGNERREHGD